MTPRLLNRGEEAVSLCTSVALRRSASDNRGQDTVVVGPCLMPAWLKSGHQKAPRP